MEGIRQKWIQAKGKNCIIIQNYLSLSDNISLPFLRSKAGVARQKNETVYMWRQLEVENLKAYHS